MKHRPTRPTGPCTQADVARHCGVSRSTVAAVLRGDPATTGVNARTHARVMKAIAELGYRPNAAAAMLRRGRTHSVGIAVPSLDLIGNTIASQIIAGIGAQSMELGYTFTLAGYAETDERYSFEKLLRESRFDGVFVLSLQQDADPRSGVLSNLGIPYIAMESQSQGGSSINFDNVGGARAMTQHLLRLGRRRIAFVGQHAKSLWASQRHEGYRLALQEQGIAYDPQLVVPVSFPLAELGPSAVRQLMEKKIAFDALLCVSDVTALAAIRELSLAGLRVPDDVSVTGYDDMHTAPLTLPAITTIRQDGRAMGRMAMNMLHQQMTHGTRPRHEQLSVKLIVRESCGSPTPGEYEV